MKVSRGFVLPAGGDSRLKETLLRRDSELTTAINSLGDDVDALSSSGIADGDKGDVTVSGGVWNIDAGTIGIAELAASGTPSASTYLRGDNSWASVPGGHDAVTVADSTSIDLTLTGQQVSAAAIFGTTAGTVCEGNDGRLSDARTPTAHDHSAGAITSGTVATARLGTGTADSTTFLRGDQTWDAPTATVADGSITLAKLSASATPSASTFLRGDYTWATPAGGSEAFPVGAVFISVVSTNPATLLGYGTWSAIAAGRVLVGRDSGDTDFDTAEETGGSKTSSAVMNHTHGVTVTDPGHLHNLSELRSATTGSQTTTIARSADTSSTRGTGAGYETLSATTGITATTADPAGGVASFSLMNPYFVVYMWKRTA